MFQAEIGAASVLYGTIALTTFARVRWVHGGREGGMKGGWEGER